MIGEKPNVQKCGLLLTNKAPVACIITARPQMHFHSQWPATAVIMRPYPSSTPLHPALRHIFHKTAPAYHVENISHIPLQNPFITNILTTRTLSVPNINHP